MRDRIELAKRNGTIERIKSYLVDEKISAKYSVSEQIAILRQRDEKPDEFAAFYEYAEQCKAAVKAYIDCPPTAFDESEVLTTKEYDAILQVRAEQVTARESAKETE